MAPHLDSNPATPASGVRTAGKSPWRIEQHKELETLLASLPAQVSCICELCDCGKCVHTHTCNRRPRTKAQGDIPLSHTKDVFKSYGNIPPRSSKRPPPTPRATDLPPMILETNQRADFIARPIEKRKPASPPKPNYERSTAPLDGVTYYQQEFVKKPLPSAPPLLERLVRRSEATFYDSTTNKEHYKQWERVNVEPAEEPPCYTGDLLYPDKDLLPVSTTQYSYPGVYAPRPLPVKQAASSLTLEGTHTFATTTNDVYRGVRGERAPLFVPNNGEPVIRKGGFMGQTQAMHDFGPKQAERVLPIEPLEATVDLTYDNGRSFETEQRSTYKGHDTVKYPVRKSCKKTPQLYERPTVPVEGITVNKAVYTPKDVSASHAPVVSRLRNNQKHDLPKFDGRTMNNEFFQNWGTSVPDRITHANFAEQYHPPEQKFEGISTTRANFSTPLKMELVTSFKPHVGHIGMSGDMDFATAYKQAYSGQPVKLCRAKLWIMQQRLKQDFQRSKSTLPKTPATAQPKIILENAPAPQLAPATPAIA